MRIRKLDQNKESSFRVPLRAFTTWFFVIVSWIVVLNTFYKYPGDSLIGLALILAGFPLYFILRKKTVSEV